jgi:hypothetical protein
MFSGVMPPKHGVLLSSKSSESTFIEGNSVFSGEMPLKTITTWSCLITVHGD